VSLPTLAPAIVELVDGRRTLGAKGFGAMLMRGGKMIFISGSSRFLSGVNRDKPVLVIPLMAM